jgi:hypothetical protein
MEKEAKKVRKAGARGRTAHELEDEVAVDIGVVRAAAVLGSPFDLRKRLGKEIVENGRAL